MLVSPECHQKLSYQSKSDKRQLHIARLLNKEYFLQQLQLLLSIQKNLNMLFG